MPDASSLTSLSDHELLARLTALCRRERETTIEILRHLNEIERRKLHLRLGYSSMFAYCTGQLRYSESAAGRRVSAARCLGRFPQVGLLLERGEINLMTLGLVANLLTEQTVDSILEKIRGKTQREVEAFASTFRPPIRLRDRVERVNVPAPLPRTPMPETRPAASVAQDVNPVTNSQTGGKKSTSAPETVSKLYIKFLADEAFMKKYKQACALLSNKLPSSPSFEAVLGEVLDDYLRRHSPRERQARRRERQGSTKTVPPRKSASGSTRRPAIPARTRDAVFVRDRGRCTYVGSNGKRCGETHHLHVDHITPVARSGTHDVRNLRLLCARHNRLEGARILGDGVMSAFHRRAPTPGRGSASARFDLSPG